MPPNPLQSHPDTPTVAQRPSAGLFDLHRAIALDGIGAVRQRCATKQQRASVNAAVATLAARASDTGALDDALYASVLVTGLPHKSLDQSATARRWEHECGQARLRYESGGTSGLPYGAKARMVLLYLQTEAIRNDSPDVDLGPSMHGMRPAIPPLQNDNNDVRRCAI